MPKRRNEVHPGGFVPGDGATRDVDGHEAKLRRAHHGDFGANDGAHDVKAWGIETRREVECACWLDGRRRIVLPCWHGWRHTNICCGRASLRRGRSRCFCGFDLMRPIMGVCLGVGMRMGVDHIGDNRREPNA